MSFNPPQSGLTMAQPAAPQAATRIGIFDSGIGGLSVLRAVRQRLPQAQCHYLADSQFTPWGDRAPAWVVARCHQLSQHLMAEGADLVLVACNTATTQAITALRARWPQHRFVGIEPGIKPAAQASRNHRVAVMATSGTLRSARMRQLVADHAQRTWVLHLPCPGLVQAIEAAWHDPDALHVQLDTLAQQLRHAEVDTVVLGCTHYPLVADSLRQRLGPRVMLIDTADAVARRVASLLAAPSTAAPGDCPPPRLMATGQPQALQEAARHWLGLTTEVQVVALAELNPLTAGR